MRIAPIAVALALAGCSASPYDTGWIYTPALHKPSMPVTTVYDARRHATPAWVERSPERCVIHMPAPDSEWHPSEALRKAIWVKEASVCNGPDGNSWLDRRHALELGAWEMATERDRSEQYSEMGGPVQ